MDNLLTISKITTLTNKNQETISHSKCNRRNGKKLSLEYRSATPSCFIEK